MPDRVATKDEVARFQRAKAKLQASESGLHQAAAAREHLDDLIEKETALRDYYRKAYEEVVDAIGGELEAPTPGNGKDKDGKVVPGWHADWIVKG